MATDRPFIRPTARTPHAAREWDAKSGQSCPPPRWNRPIRQSANRRQCDFSPPVWTIAKPQGPSFRPFPCQCACCATKSSQGRSSSAKRIRRKRLNRHVRSAPRENKQRVIRLGKTASSHPQCRPPPPATAATSADRTRGPSHSIAPTQSRPAPPAALSLAAIGGGVVPKHALAASAPLDADGRPIREAELESPR